MKPHPLDEVRGAEVSLKGGEAGPLVACSSDYLAVCYHFSRLEEGYGRPHLERERGLAGQDCNNYHRIKLLSVPGKMLTHLLLMQIHSQLLKLQRPEQCGKLTTDHIPVVCVLVKHQRDIW